MWRRRLGVENRRREGVVSQSSSSSSNVFLLLLFTPRGRGDGLEVEEGGVRAFRDRMGVDLIGAGLWRRLGFAVRGVGAGDPFRRDCSARQVPRRPFPEGTSSSDGGGVVNRRLGVKRDRDEGRRMSHGKAEGSNIVIAIVGTLERIER